MILRPVNSNPKKPGEWVPVRVGSNAEPTGFLLRCPGCGALLHIGPAPHPSGHAIEWHDSFKRFTVKTPIICGITRNGQRCEWIGTVEHGVASLAG
jgi:hypothetical protein